MVEARLESFVSFCEAWGPGVDPRWRVEGRRRGGEGLGGQTQRGGGEGVVAFSLSVRRVWGEFEELAKLWMPPRRPHHRHRC